MRSSCQVLPEWFAFHKLVWFQLKFLCGSNSGGGSLLAAAVEEEEEKKKMMTMRRRQQQQIKNPLS
jgi:hypothetical protein